MSDGLARSARGALLAGALGLFACGPSRAPTRSPDVVVNAKSETIAPEELETLRARGEQWTLLAEETDRLPDELLLPSPRTAFVVRSIEAWIRVVRAGGPKIETWDREEEHWVAHPLPAPVDFVAARLDVSRLAPRPSVVVAKHADRIAYFSYVHRAHAEQATDWQPVELQVDLGALLPRDVEAYALWLDVAPGPLGSESHCVWAFDPHVGDGVNICFAWTRQPQAAWDRTAVTRDAFRMVASVTPFVVRPAGS